MQSWKCNSKEESPSAKKEGDIHVVLHLCENIEIVIINHLPIYEITSHWAP